ncbi:hypothetical protein [Bacillus cereus]|uniref:hypothetical protein n=1 Tax=Bacillus cereus TaxID=1396 RepID=UPI002AC2243A|nr:hypothetical protein [Bacillus cereus]MDZ4481606.1 hypothetical protein [Bacillus cereus]
MYKEIEIGLDLGAKFLTEDTAYFLGLLMADEKISWNNKTYWISPVRHNPTHFEQSDLEEHYNIVKKLARSLNKQDFTHFISFYKAHGVKFPKFNAGKNGFVAIFEQKIIDYSLNDLIQHIKEPLLASTLQVRKAFLIGVFDGRSSYDKTYKLISLDIENENLINLLSQIFKQIGVTATVNNLASARKRANPTAKPRKPQIRIKHLDFLREIGLLSPVRFKKATTELASDTFINRDDILEGHKLIG